MKMTGRRLTFLERRRLFSGQISQMTQISKRQICVICEICGSLFLHFSVVFVSSVLSVLHFFD